MGIGRADVEHRMFVGVEDMDASVCMYVCMYVWREGGREEHHHACRLCVSGSDAGWEGKRTWCWRRSDRRTYKLEYGRLHG